MNAIDKIISEKRIQGKKWSELAEGLSISETALSVAFSRKSVNDDYLRHVAKKLGVDIEKHLKHNQQNTKDELTEPRSTYKLRTDVSRDDQTIPLYNLEASAGLVQLFNDGNGINAIDTLRIPNLPKCDGAIFIVGDSMYPLLKSGDIIIYKQVDDIRTDIFYGEMYLISVKMGNDEHITVKWVQRSDKGEDHITLVSENRHHQDKVIPKERINAMAIIKATVRINSM